MLRRIPSSITNIQTPNKSYLLIDQYYLLMMAPKERNDDVIRMSDDFYIPMKTHQMFLCVFAVIVDRYFRLLVNDYVNYDASVCRIF